MCNYSRMLLRKNVSQEDTRYNPEFKDGRYTVDEMIRIKDN